MTKRKVLLCAAAMAAITYLSSCARGITPYEAANGKAKCGRYIR